MSLNHLHPLLAPPAPPALPPQPTSADYPHVSDDVVVYRDDDEEEDDDEEDRPPSSPPSDNSSSSPHSDHRRSGCHHHRPYVDAEPHISTQFYTFNHASHALMLRCLLDCRQASPSEIRAATPPAVLASWRSVWKDRNEDTAYSTAWKRIQDKLAAGPAGDGGDGDGGDLYVLYFKSNPNQWVPHVDQWHEIVVAAHADADLKHLGVKDTLDRIKQIWTVGAKFYGIPESFIRACVAGCPVCTDAAAAAQRTKRRRFEYTESFEVPAREVPQRLRQLAAKHQVVLCIRQKYVRYRPFLAEVKDYACHRAGEPVSATKKARRTLKREPYASKRCGCGFRIRAIMPIMNYNEKEKTFVYQEEGMAVFKLFAIHTGHEPGPSDGNARIIHRVVGHKGSFLMDGEADFGLNEDLEIDSEDFSLVGKDTSGSPELEVRRQLQEMRFEIGMLEGKIPKMPTELLGGVSRELSDLLSRVRSIGDVVSRPVGLLLDKPRADEVLVGAELGQWGDLHPVRIYGQGKETELIEDEEDSFERTWDQMGGDCSHVKSLMSSSCKSDKWLKECTQFDEKTILDCHEDSKLIKPIRHDGTMEADPGLVGIQVDSFYQENPKWYDSPCVLDTTGAFGDVSDRHGGIV